MDTNEYLISQVQKYTMLYNKYSMGYKNHEKKKRIWKLIGQRIGESDENSRHLWAKLKVKYLKCTRRVAADPSWKCNWPYFDQMRFLDEVDDVFGKPHFPSKRATADDYSVNLIRLIKKHRILYDRTHVDHRTVTKRTAVWEHIAKELNSKVQDCKIRWKRLKSRYYILLNAKKSSKPIWAYYDLMGFMADHDEDDGKNSCEQTEPTMTPIQKVEHDDVFIEKLIEEVKKYRILYDTTIANIDESVKDELWIAIACKLDKTVKECQDKFKELAQKYEEHYKKNMTIAESEAKYWKQLEFLNNIDNEITHTYVCEADIEKSLMDLIEEDDDMAPAEEPLPNNTEPAITLNGDDYSELIEEVVEPSDEEDTKLVEIPINSTSQKEEKKYSTPDYDKFVVKRTDKTNSMLMLFEALALAVQECKLPQQQLLKLHQEVAAFVFKGLAKYKEKNKNLK